MGKKRWYLRKSSHPNTWMAETAPIGELPTSHGSGDLQASVIESGARIDDFSIVYTAAAVRQEAHVGTNCMIGPEAGVMFGAHVSRGCYVGAGAFVGEGVGLDRVIQG